MVKLRSKSSLQCLYEFLYSGPTSKSRVGYATEATERARLYANEGDPKSAGMNFSFATVPLYARDDTFFFKPDAFSHLQSQTFTFCGGCDFHFRVLPGDG